jgi:hypothetical protein
MSPNQIKLARHALGLGNGRKVSYRNSFVAAPGHWDYDDWIAMTRAGHAVRIDGSTVPFGGDDLFRMTRAGADLVRLPDEIVPGTLPEAAERQGGENAP